MSLFSFLFLVFRADWFFDANVWPSKFHPDERTLRAWWVGRSEMMLLRTHRARQCIWRCRRRSSCDDARHPVIYLYIIYGSCCLAVVVYASPFNLLSCAFAFSVSGKLSLCTWLKSSHFRRTVHTKQHNQTNVHTHTHAHAYK